MSTVSAESSIPPMVKELDRGMPLRIVNAKKESRVSTVSYSDIYAHVDKDSDYLWQQINLYSPNIIVCGGS